MSISSVPISFMYVEEFLLPGIAHHKSTSGLNGHSAENLGTPFLDLPGLWRFVEKVIGPSCCNVRSRKFRTIIFGPLRHFFVTDGRGELTYCPSDNRGTIPLHLG